MKKTVVNISSAIAISWVFLVVNTPALFFLEKSIILQVPDSGNYTFYVSCDDLCELWKYDVDEHGFENKNEKADESLANQPIIVVDQWTGHLEWNK